MPSTVEKLEQEALEWLECVTGEKFEENKSVQEILKDGTILCKSFNACFSDMKVKYVCSSMPFKQMENISTFLHALSKLPNFRSFDLFSTVDLYEGKNMSQVIRCVLACKRFAEKEVIRRGIEILHVTQKEKESRQEEEEEDILEVKSEELEMVQETREKEKGNDDDDKLDISEPEAEAEESFIKVDEAVSSFEIQPEIILIDSPNLADDESEGYCHIQAIEEEYETFTQDNPGTFEIQVSN